MPVRVINATSPRIIEHGFHLEHVEVLLLNLLIERDRILLLIASANTGPEDYIDDLREGLEAYKASLLAGKAINNITIDAISAQQEEGGLLSELFG